VLHLNESCHLARVFCHNVMCHVSCGMSHMNGKYPQHSTSGRPLSARTPCSSLPASASHLDRQGVTVTDTFVTETLYARSCSMSLLKVPHEGSHTSHDSIARVGGGGGGGESPGGVRGEGGKQ